MRIWPSYVSFTGSQALNANKKKAPRYVDIALELEKEVDKLSPNTLLPTEEQLSARFGVSRITLRAALDLLENRGVLSRMRGRGTVVSPKKIIRHFSPLLSFEADLAAQNVDFKTRILSYEPSVSPPDDLNALFNLQAGDKVGRLSIVRVVDDRVVCHDLRYYPPDIARGIDAAEVETRSMSEIAERLAGGGIARSSWDSEIIPPDADVAAALGLSSRTLVLSNNYIWFLANGRAIETGTISYRVDRCKFRFEESLL